MTDLIAIAERYPGDTNGRDPLELSELTALTAAADLGDVAECLRKLARLLPADALDRRVIRNRAIAVLKGAKIADAAGLVDAALGTATSPADDDRQGNAVAFTDVEPWPEPVDGAALLDGAHAFVTRFLGLPPGAADLLAAFAIYTYVVDAFAAATYLVAHSPAPQCGKTRLLEVLAALVRRQWLTIVPSTAVLFRVLEEYAPTLLLDEAEVVHGRGEAARDVRALLQSGYRRGAVVPRCVGDDNEVRNFRVFGPKVFALIGELPAALFDRCIPVEMQRRPRGARLIRFRPTQVEPEALTLRRRARRWATDHLEALRHVEIPPLEFLNERAEEVWEPLLAVGHVAGGGWYDRLRRAAEHLSGGRATTSAGVDLLTDLRTVFDDRGGDRLASSDLATALNELEGHRWPDWNHGKGITPNGIARLLRDFGVTPGTVRLGNTTAKGYRREQLEAGWEQYSPPTAVTPSQPSQDRGHLGKDNRNCPNAVTVEKPGIVTESGQCDGVTDEKKGGPGLEVGLPLAEPGAVPADASENSVDPRLIITALGLDRFEVTGGAVPHIVQLGPGIGTLCDCRDFAYRGRARDCKHITAVRRDLAGADEDSGDQLDDDEQVVVPVNEDDSPF